MKRASLWAGWALFCALPVAVVLAVLGAGSATFAAVFCIAVGSWLDRVYFGRQP